MIGCGNIGGRLLQSLAGLDTSGGRDTRIAICEPGDAARVRAAALAREVRPALGEALDGDGLRIDFHDSMAALEEAGVDAVDLVLVTTASAIRFGLAREAIERFKPLRILFEKFLFPRRSEYAEMQTLLDDGGIEAWVHCSRNEAPGYHMIRERIADRTGPLHMTVAGGGYSLGSNAIHFLALYNHLTGATAVASDTAGLREDVAGNKRPGYVELVGDIRLLYDDGGTLTLIDHGARQPATILASTPDAAFVVDEAAQTCRFRTSAAEWRWEEAPMKMILASQLSAVFGGMLAGEGTSLPAYAQSARDHLALIEAFNRVLSPDQPDRDECPIT